MGDKEITNFRFNEQKPIGWLRLSYLGRFWAVGNLRWPCDTVRATPLIKSGFT